MAITPFRIRAERYGAAMRGLFILTAVVLLTACQSEGEKAEDRLRMVKANGGSLDEVCAASRKVAEAYLNDRDNDHYPMAKLNADIACNEADIARLNGG